MSVRCGLTIRIFLAGPFKEVLCKLFPVARSAVAIAIKERLSSVWLW